MAQAANVTMIKTVPYKIEQGHVPPARASAPGAYVAALQALLSSPIGASFFVQATDKKSQEGSLRTIASREARSRGGGGCLTLRRVDGGFRVWKIAEPKLR